MKKYLPSLLILALVLVATITFAQGGPPPQPGPGPPSPPAVPIDGGILALLAGGIAYGAKKLYNKG